MELSKRISSLKPSPTVALNGKAKEIAASGTKVFNFAVGEPDFSTPDIVVGEAIKSLQNGRTKYGPAGGGLPLRKAICRKLQRDNQLDYTPEQVVVGIGAKEILFHIFLATLNEGDEVILPAPYWVSYTSQIEAAGAKAVIIPMPTDITAMTLTPEMIEPYWSEKTRAIVLTSPNNPGGYVLDKSSLESLGRYLEDKSAWIVSDEI